MSSKSCHSKRELELLGAGNEYGECSVSGETINCHGISATEVQQLCEEARRFLIKYEAVTRTGEISMFAGLLTFGLGSIVAVVNTNLKINALKKEFQVDSECFKTSVFRLYSIGYRVTTVTDSNNFKLEKVGEHIHGRIF